MTATKLLPIVDRIMEQVTEDPLTGCWIYNGYLNESGYGRIAEGGGSHRSLYVHRVVYEAMVAPIPPGLTIDHLCFRPPCVNWTTHMECVTRGVNLLRGTAVQRAAETRLRRTACRNGHLYDAVTRTGARICRTCRNETQRRYYARLVLAGAA